MAAAGELATIGILATFLVFFFLRDGDKAWLWLFQDASDQKRERITAAGDDALARVGGYLRGTTVLAALMALTDLAFMLLLGVPLAVPLAVLVFLGGYIPYFGGIVATLIVLLVTLAALGTGPSVRDARAHRSCATWCWATASGPWSTAGPSTSTRPIVLIALPAGYQLAGVIGLFAAVPVTAVVLAVAGAVVAVVDPDPPPVLPGLVPAWLDRMAQFSWRLLVAIALIALAIARLHCHPAGPDPRRPGACAHGHPRPARTVVDAARSRTIPRRRHRRRRRIPRHQRYPRPDRRLPRRAGR